MSDVVEVRRCIVGLPRFHEPKVGNFVKYGVVFDTDESNHLHAVDVAIVELDDGQVIEVSPKNIKFSDM